MTLYAGLDVGDKATHLCVVDGDGAILWRGACATDPGALAFTLKKHAPGLVRAVLETGALSAFLHHELIERGLPAAWICIRHAKGVLSVRRNKSDAHDAEGPARLGLRLRVAGQGTRLARRLAG
jgi:transposase